MKKFFKLFGIIAIVAVIGFSFAACGGSDDSGGNPGGNTTGSGDNPPSGTPVEGANLEAKLAWLKTNAQSNTTYTINVNKNEFISYTDVEYTGKSNITIVLWGSGSARTITNTGIFVRGSSVKLVLDNNITLQHQNSTSSGTVSLSDGGTLEMKAGSKITGGGVSVRQGTFIMNGGTISGNTAGSAVSVHEDGIFTMNGGEISGNSFNLPVVIGWGDNNGTRKGGTFTMNGGKIFSNGGSGVTLQSGTVTASKGPTFIMNGGEISGNTDSGVKIYRLPSSSGEKGSFTMNNGTISGNTAIYDGGGVYVSDGLFTMNGGIISGNTANRSGGGVYVNYQGTFHIANGTIYGSDASPANLKNNAANNNGAALSISESGPAQYGTLSGTTWTKKGDLSTTNNTITVENGVLK